VGGTTAASRRCMIIGEDLGGYENKSSEGIWLESRLG